MLQSLIQEVINQLHQTLVSYMALDSAETFWDPEILTEALIIFLFTINQDVKLDKTRHIVSD